VHADEQDSNKNCDIGLKIAPVPLKLEGKDQFWSDWELHRQRAGGLQRLPHLEPRRCGIRFQPQSLPAISTQQEAVEGGGEVLPGRRQNLDRRGLESAVRLLRRAGNGPLLITRNLTPDHTGLPEGGHTLEQF